MKRMLLPQSLVASLLSGATQVSVPVKPQPWWIEQPQMEGDKWVGVYSKDPHITNPTYEAHCPFPAGTEVWVPERWSVYDVRRNGDRTVRRIRVQYQHDGVVSEWIDVPNLPRFDALVKQFHRNGVRTAGSMLTDLARLRYIIEGVNAGRVQEELYCPQRQPDIKRVLHALSQDQSRTLWNAAYPDYPWDSNPWRYTYTLRRL